MMEKKRILVTGAGGFIGSHVVDWAVGEGHYVIGVDKKRREEWSRGSCSNVEFYFDVLLKDACGNSLFSIIVGEEKFDICFHLAAESRIQPSFEDPMLYVRSNVLGTAAVLEECRKQGARMVYAGSSTADDSVAKNVYATTKYQGEELCRAWAESFGVKVSIARFYNVYGPRQVEEGKYATVVGIFEKQKREGKKLTVTGNGSQRRDFTHVDDIVSGLVAIAERGDSSMHYSLGTGVNHSILEVARMFVEDKDIEFIPRPPGESSETMARIFRTHALGWNSKYKLEDYVKLVVGS